VSQIQHAIFLNHRSTHEDHNTIYFTIFGAQMSTQTFSKAFFFPNNKRKPKLFFFLTTGPAHGNQQDHDRFWPAQPGGETPRQPGSGFGPRPSGLEKTEGGGKNNHDHATLALSASRQRGGRQRPTAIFSHDQARWSTHGSMRKW
jgi:hypothetical protein